MNSESHFLNSLRQWPRPRSKSVARTSSRSSQSSAEYSRPVTPLDSIFVRQQRSNVSDTSHYLETEEYWEPANLRELGVHSSEETRRKPFYKQARSERSRSETITPATIRRILQQDFERMRLPFPKPFGQASTSSDTSFECDNVLRTCDEEFGRKKNRFNDDTNSISSDADDKTHISTKPFPLHGSYSEPISHSASLIRLTSSLRLRPKRGAITLLKSLKPSPTPDFPRRLEDIEFDWSDQLLTELSIRMRLLEEHLRTIDRASPAPGSLPVTVPSRSLDLTPEEVALAREKTKAEQRRFIFKELKWSHRSLVSAHSEDIVPYPFAYDKVNIQT
jgi:hypothetical protein